MLCQAIMGLINIFMKDEWLSCFIVMVISCVGRVFESGMRRINDNHWFCRVWLSTHATHLPSSERFKSTCIEFYVNFKPINFITGFCFLFSRYILYKEPGKLWCCSINNGTISWQFIQFYPCKASISLLICILAVSLHYQARSKKI